MEKQKIYLEHNFNLWYSLSQIRSIQVFLYIYVDLIRFLYLIFMDKLNIKLFSCSFWSAQSICFNNSSSSLIN